MSYTKELVCLANSRKLAGRCVAGKEIALSSLGTWVRPISDQPGGELSFADRRDQNGQDVRILDIVEIQMLKHVPQGCQTENHLIDNQYCWSKKGVLAWFHLSALEDSVAGDLWINGYSSSNGVNDRVPLSLASSLQTSLLFLSVSEIVLQVRNETSFSGTKKKVRAEFSCNTQNYRLAVTDPIFENAFLRRPIGDYAIGESYMCLSLGEPYGTYCYKLVASIVTPPEAKK
jgi:putative nucleic acid modification protein with dual OB domain